MISFEVRNNFKIVVAFITYIEHDFVKMWYDTSHYWCDFMYDTNIIAYTYISTGSLWQLDVNIYFLFFPKFHLCGSGILHVSYMCDLFELNVLCTIWCSINALYLCYLSEMSDMRARKLRNMTQKLKMIRFLVYQNSSSNFVINLTRWNWLLTWCNGL